MFTNWDTELAKMFKERENKATIGNVVGEVTATDPELQISIIDGNIILYESQLYCCDHVLSGYSRQFTAPNLSGTVDITDSLTITGLSGTVELTDTLATGDKVLLIPTADEQTWFIVDKITKL
jgi:hypothetical protein